jgi:hypothetical protein
MSDSIENDVSNFLVFTCFRNRKRKQKGAQIELQGGGVKQSNDNEGWSIVKMKKFATVLNLENCDQQRGKSPKNFASCRGESWQVTVKC